MVESSNPNQSIEDVLSSIRRLVRDDVPGKGAAHITSDDKLVLTPQLRVTEPEDPYQTIPNLADDDADITTDGAPDTLGVFRSGAVQSLTDDPVDDAPDPEDAGLMDIHKAEEDAEEAVILGRINGEVSDDGPNWPEADVKFARTLAALFETAHAPSDTDLDDDDDPLDDEEIPQAETAQEPLTLSGAIPFPKVQKTERSDALSDALSENVLGLPDDLVLDEEALRDLIAEVVREELAGHLGERITRNVRKLVRREIRRLMASEEFE